MIYGASGYTGRLIVEEAIKRGHRPVLAGRSPQKVSQIAREHDLEWMAFPLEDVRVIGEAIAEMELVLHAAGPFLHTSDPMIRACLATRTHYLDITGEIPVFEQTFSYDETARKIGIALIPGVGYDVVPSDCLARYVADRVPGAQTLEIALSALSRVSSGTAKSALEMIPASGKIRRNGKLESYRWGMGSRMVKFPHGEIPVMPIPWGDLSTAYRTTAILNITTYMALPPALILLARYGAPLGTLLLRSSGVRRGVGKIVETLFRGPDEELRCTGKSYLWARAAQGALQSAEAWLETAEPYRFTALSAVQAVEQTLAIQPAGALTPAVAFGADFVLEIEGTRRMDRLSSE